MCLILLLGLFVGYNNIHKNPNPNLFVNCQTEIDSNPVEMNHNYGCYGYNLCKTSGNDDRYNLDDKEMELFLKINRYFEMAKNVKILEASLPLPNIENNEEIETILHDLFDYNSIQPMRIKNGGLMSDW